MVKRIIIIIAFMLVASSIFAQYMMSIKKTDNTSLDILISDISEISFFNCGTTITYSGQTYNTVLIGNQCWFKENLNVGTRIDGSSNQTNNSTIEKYCYDNNEANCTTYGGLYQWAEAVQYANGATNTASPSPAFSGNIQGICPTGWHIPSYAEFQTLIAAVSNNGNSLKAIGQGTGDGAGTNTSGFSALLVGYHYYFSGGVFSDLGTYTYFWSSTEYDVSTASALYIHNSDSNINTSYHHYKVQAFSVRCIKD